MTVIQRWGMLSYYNEKFYNTEYIHVGLTLGTFHVIVQVSSLYWMILSV